MIVCLCRSVTERAIRAARARGADTVEAVAASTGAGTGCGCCRGTVAKMLAGPCRPEPCSDCPNRASGAVPRRIAAAGVKSP